MSVKFVRSAMITAAGIATALALSGSAQALTDKVFRYSSPQTGFYTIDRMAMVPDHDGAVYLTEWSGGLTTKGDALTCFNAGVNLPQHATITDVTVSYRSGTHYNPHFYLQRHKFSDGAAHTMAFAVPLDDSSTLKAGSLTLVPDLIVIDNRFYSYGFGVCLGADDAFYAARIRYTYETAGD